MGRRGRNGWRRGSGWRGRCGASGRWFEGVRARARATLRSGRRSRLERGTEIEEIVEVDLDGRRS